MGDCIFCKIVGKQIPARTVYEDADILAFEDIRPKAPVHVLIIPKEHFDSLNEIAEDKKEVLARILAKAPEIARLKGVRSSGYRLVLNTAGDSGQEIFHIHFHLLGGRRMTWPPG